MRRRREKRELGARSLSGFAWKRDTPILRISYPPPMMENFRRKLHPQKRYENRQHFSLHIYLRTDGWESHQRGGPFGAEAFCPYGRLAVCSPSSSSSSHQTANCIRRRKMMIRHIKALFFQYTYIPVVPKRFVNSFWQKIYRKTWTMGIFLPSGRQQKGKICWVGERRKGILGISPLLLLSSSQSVESSGGCWFLPSSPPPLSSSSFVH